ETGITFLVVTHDQEEALGMADRIALMNHGRIAQLGTPRDLYERPATRFAADFIGAMNFFEGRVRDGGVEVEGLGLLPGQLDTPVAVPERAALAVRPERVRLQAESAQAGGLGGAVVGVSYLGQDLVVHVALDGGAEPLVVRLGSGDPMAG